MLARLSDVTYICAVDNAQVIRRMTTNAAPKKASLKDWHWADVLAALRKADWRHDGPMSSVLLVGNTPFGEVAPHRGKKQGFRATSLLPTGLSSKDFTTREAAEAFVVEAIDRFVRVQLTPEAQSVLAHL